MPSLISCVADVERGQEADDVAARATAQQCQAVLVGLAHQCFGQCGIGLVGVAVADQFHRHHRTMAGAQVADFFREAGLQSLQACREGLR